MKKNISTIFLICGFFIGLSLLLYPTVSNLWNYYHQSKVIEDYDKFVKNISEKEYEQTINLAKEYNELLVNRVGKPFELSKEELEKYNSLLNIGKSRLMGYIEIPFIDVKLPIYHDTSEEVLSLGVGHLAGSSLPVGGKSTHSILSAHRGLPSAKLFTNLDKLYFGDTFTIHILNEKITYEVDQILIVKPDEIGSLYIKKDMDYVTLVTCTPYRNKYASFVSKGT